MSFDQVKNTSKRLVLSHCGLYILSGTFLLLDQWDEILLWDFKGGGVHMSIQQRVGWKTDFDIWFM